MNDMICIIFNITYYVSKQQKAGYVSFSNNIYTYSLGRKEENTKKCSLFMVLKLRVLFFFWDLFFFVIFYEISLICKTTLWNNSLTCLLQISENKCERNCYLFFLCFVSLCLLPQRMQRWRMGNAQYSHSLSSFLTFLAVTCHIDITIKTAEDFKDQNSNVFQH